MEDKTTETTPVVTEDTAYADWKQSVKEQVAAEQALIASREKMNKAMNVLAQFALK